ncbi:MAG: AAA family ATPase [Candidatus Omnitrophica bacterium]|nr:AAA family ATPase [Candidatus Omnitrophota bacterium]MBU2251487.1 AAA family ATPase [Candidatus Omnitrophota bacterium]MBU2266163.1 AAA family ATPase [Candidatus Omnitrophota bacterium]
MNNGKFDFCGEFKEPLELIEDSDKHLFITGKAGSGKSTLLRYFKDITEKNVITLAPTGIAAINVQGQTIHSFFSFPLGFIQKEQVKKLYRAKKKIIQNLDLLLIDEASMVRADMLDAIDYSLRINRKKMDIPFGGVRIVMFGDVFQLPPVVERSMEPLIKQYYGHSYFFNAKVINQIKLHRIQLDRIYRQTDKKFIDLLGRIRLNECGLEDIAMLNERVDAGNVKNRCIVLTTTNKNAERINKSFLEKIDSKQYQYTAAVTENYKSSLYPTEASLSLKKGARVILLNNDKEKRWVNGTLAEIAGVTDDSVRIRIEDEVYILEKFTWEKIRYTFDDLTQEIKQEVDGSFRQYPLKLAWAITIHKSQGQTFEKVIIDIGHGAFSPGQLYVALSRCRSLEGITLDKPLSLSDIIIDENVYSFSDQ